MDAGITLDLPPGRVDAWSAAVETRRSTRTFLTEPVDAVLLERLEALTASLPEDAGARVAVAREVEPSLFRGIVGSYGRVTGAPSALFVIGREGHPTEQEDAGYLGEAVILEACRSGLETCWVGGFFRPTVAAGLVSLDPGERVLAVSPVGLAPGRPTRHDRSMNRLARSHRRRSIEGLTSGPPWSTWPRWAQEGVRLARLAPSAVNRQPWRFSLDDGSVVVSLDSPRDTYRIAKRLDCGIAMLHLEVGARSAGATGVWEPLTTPGVARFAVDGAG